ncbi:MAG: glycoside hydrolase domain-containing protein [Verrucomicrobiota bacterium]
MEKVPAAYVDPFLGNGATDLPKPEGIAGTWFWPKAQVGNTHPGACYPFGMVSACAYSGAYPTGYGCYDRSTEGPPGKLFEELSASGFTHFQQSGTGDMRIFYNHVRVTPLAGERDESLSALASDKRWTLENEEASPGYYATTLKESGVRAELTVAAKSACHRYTFPETVRPGVLIDMSTNGVAVEGRNANPTEAHIEATSSTTAQGMVVINGIPLHVYLETNISADEWGIWVDGSSANVKEFAMSQADPQRVKPFGFYFCFGKGEVESVEVKLGFSFRSVNQAQANMEEISNVSFDDVCQKTQALWTNYLERVHVSGGSEEQKEIFYSALYHSLIKPCDMENESPFWPEEGPFFSDISTLWDIYKTQLPLMLSVYPERGRDFVNALLEMAERHHRFPIGYVIAKRPILFEKQASALAHLTIIDAFFRGLKGINWKRALDLMIHELNNGKGATYQSQGSVFPFTHTLDLASAYFASAQLAQYFGKNKLYKHLMRLAGWWRNVYNKETGTLKASEYYEGGVWNYSFRLLHDMESRISLCDSRKGYVEMLDRFFGYGEAHCKQLGFPPDPEEEKAGYGLRRFTGLNNEPDMETPYAYIYAGRHDRTAEVVRAAMKYQYTTGPGGLPGNDDSGALSSWYVWSAIGIFPVSGQEVYLIGSPIFDRSEIKLENRTFIVTVSENSDKNIYVQSAKLNGDEIDRAYLRLDEFEDGGELYLEMGPEPSKWATKLKPPSWRI